MSRLLVVVIALAGLFGLAWGARAYWRTEYSSSANVVAVAGGDADSSGSASSESGAAGGAAQQDAKGDDKKSSDEKKSSPIGKQVEHLDPLRDVRGSSHDLAGLVGEKGLVLAFLGTECPLANRSMPHILEIERHFKRQGFQFAAIYSNEQESLDQIAAHASDYDIPFPVLKDPGQKLADRLGVTRTPEVCLLDNKLKLLYRGRLSDQYGVSHQAPTSENEYLLDALEFSLANRPITVPITSVDGCLLSRRGPQTARTDVTYSKDVAPIFQQHCETCHRPGQVAPFSLVTYDDAAAHAEAIREAVSERRMPPWHADARFGHFRNERRLSDEEIGTVLAWIDAGTPVGDVAQLPKPINWPDDWSVGQPDVVVELAEPQHVPAEGPQEIRQAYVPGAITDELFAEDRWVEWAEVRPSAMGVVHHVLVHVVPPGELPPPESRSPTPSAFGWAPGEPAYIFPPGTALKIPKGSKLCFELHYSPNGMAAQDRPKLGLKFATDPPQRKLTMASPAKVTLNILPDEPNHHDEIAWTYLTDVRLLGLMGHMHLRGKSYKIEAKYPDGRRETLLSVPRYDFNWQTFYWLNEPLLLPKGTEMHVTSVWDNSRFNPNNPDPKAKVRTGWKSDNEMQGCWNVFEAIIPSDASSDSLIESDAKETGPAGNQL